MLAHSRKIEVIYNEYTDKEYPHNMGYPLKFIERIVLCDGEEVYRDKLNTQIYLQDKSFLRQLENWVFGSPFKKSQNGGNAGSNCRNFRCLFCIFRFKFLRKVFKFKSQSVDVGFQNFFLGNESASTQKIMGFNIKRHRVT